MYKSLIFTLIYLVFHNVAFSDQFRSRFKREIIVKAGLGDDMIETTFLYHGGLHLIQLEYKKYTKNKIFITKEQLAGIDNIQFNSMSVWIGAKGNGHLSFRYGELAKGMEYRNYAIFNIEDWRLDSYRIAIQQKHGEPKYIYKKIVKPKEKKKQRIKINVNQIK